MDMLTKLSNHIAMMAPHQKERYGGTLLIEARGEIARLVAEKERLTVLCGEQAAALKWANELLQGKRVESTTKLLVNGVPNQEG